MITELTVIGSMPKSSSIDPFFSFLRMAAESVRARGTVHRATSKAMSRLLDSAWSAEFICPVALSSESSCRYHFRLKVLALEREEEAMNERTTTDAMGPRMNRKEATVYKRASNFPNKVAGFFSFSRLLLW